MRLQRGTCRRLACRAAQLEPVREVDCQRLVAAFEEFVLEDRVVPEDQEAPLAYVPGAGHAEGCGLVLGLDLVAMQVDPGLGTGGGYGARPCVEAHESPDPVQV